MQIFGVTGEALGTIGVEEEEHQQEPVWKKILAGKPSVSVRKGIAWVSECFVSEVRVTHRCLDVWWEESICSRWALMFSLPTEV